MKQAVIINGVAAEISIIHFLPKFLEEYRYRVKVINILDKDYRLKNIKAGTRPDLIIGFSLGGMIAMQLAEKYPKSKLMLMATGVRVNPENWWFKLLLRVSKNKKMVKMMREAINIPEEMLIPIYELVNQLPVDDGLVEEQYRRDMSDNINFFRKVGLAKWLEITRYCRQTDLTETAAGLKNQTLIFSGEKDGLMAVEMGKEMNRLLRNSRLIITEGGHFDVVTKDDLKVVGDFI